MANASSIKAVTFANGDVLGARARSNGTVEIYRNGTLLGSRDVSSWSLYASGGQLGFTVNGGTTTRLDNPSTPLRAGFGGGTYTGYLPTIDDAFRTVAYRDSEPSTVNGAPAVVVTPPANQTWRSYYYLGGKRVAMRTRYGSGNPDVVNYLHSDHLGSTSLTTNASGGLVAQARYYPYGGIRWESSTTPTDYRFTGQRLDSYINMYEMGARWYDPLIGRFVSADSIVPGAGNPQALNRYSCVFNSPLNLVDPSGNDPLDSDWEREFREQHGGRDPDDRDRQDRLFSLMFCGSGANCNWTKNDWAAYTTQRDAIWGNTATWSSLAQGLSGFSYFTGRLANLYRNDETRQFVQAFALMFGGIEYGSPVLAAARSLFGPRLPFLHFGDEGWNPALVDEEGQQSHHYTGLFYAGYFFGDWVGGIAEARELFSPSPGPFGIPIPNRTRPNTPDIRLGQIAIAQGQQLWRYSSLGAYAPGTSLNVSFRDVASWISQSLRP